MSSQPKNYLIGWISSKKEIKFDTYDFMTLPEAIKAAQKVVVENDEEEEDWIVFEIKAVKKYKLVKDIKAVEIPVKS